MQDHIQLDQKQINDDLLAGVLGMPKWWLPAVLFLTLVVFAGLGSFGYMMNKGLGVTGLNRPVMWGFFIVNFVFWIGISHAGIMISAILRLTQAEWRRPVTRAAEVMTVFSLMAALHTPLFHVGRPWREMWVFPYDFARGVWPNVRSPFVWDPSAVGTYLIASSLFVFIALIPDLAIVRDRAVNPLVKKIYGTMCLGWRGTPRQWKLQAVAGILLSALVLPVFVSVHSIVSWDFAVLLGVEGWHSTIFAPYFVAGAIFSGFGMVLTLLIPSRAWFGLKDVITVRHLDNMAKIILLTGSIVGYAYAMEFFIAWYSGNPYEQFAFVNRAFGPYAWAYWTMLSCNVLSPSRCFPPRWPPIPDCLTALYRRHWCLAALNTRISCPSTTSASIRRAVIITP